MPYSQYLEKKPKRNIQRRHFPRIDITHINSGVNWLHCITACDWMMPVIHNFIGEPKLIWNGNGSIVIPRSVKTFYRMHKNFFLLSNFGGNKAAFRSIYVALANHSESKSQTTNETADVFSKKPDCHGGTRNEWKNVMLKRICKLVECRCTSNRSNHMVINIFSFCHTMCMRVCLLSDFVRLIEHMLN